MNTFTFLSIFSFVLGLVLLGWGSYLIVNLSLNLAQKLKLSSIAVGAVFIAIVTAMPETFITLFALRKSQMIAFGNLVGSNIINIPLAIGLPALFIALKFRRFTRRVSLIMIISALLALFLMLDGHLTPFEGWILIFGYLIYVIYVIKKERNNNQKFNTKEYSNFKITLLFLVSGILLFSGAYLIIESGLDILERFGFSELYIGATIIALGSIIPEVAVSIAAVIKKQGEILIGNILGDNIFTMFVILGLVGIIKPLSITKKELVFSILPIIFITSVLFLITLKKDKKIGKIEGLILLISYVIILLVQTLFIKRY